MNKSVSQGRRGKTRSSEMKEKGSERFSGDD